MTAAEFHAGTQSRELPARDNGPPERLKPLKPPNPPGTQHQPLPNRPERTTQNS